MTWLGGRDGASNDPEDYHPNLTLRDGYPVLYDCTEELGDSISTQTLHFDFDYDVSILANSNLTLNLRNLEWSVLWNVAQSIGMKTCNFELQKAEIESGGPLLRGAKTLHDNSTYVALLGSDGVDSVDLGAGKNVMTCDYFRLQMQLCTKCITNLACRAIYEGDCYDSVPDQYDDTICFPMQGRMHAIHAGHDVEGLENYLLKQVESVMNTTLVRVGDVKYVSYIGTRGNTTNTNSAKSGGQSTRASSIREKSSVTFIAVGIGIGVLVIMVMALLVRRKLRKRSTTEKDNEEISHPMILTDLTDIETVPADDVGTQPAASLQVVAEPQELQEPALIEPEPKPIPIATQRRRRKKKKKRRKRKPPPPIDPMESITEENEEEVYAESECDSDWSEYSTDDDESSTSFSEQDLLFPRISSVGSNLSEASAPLSLASNFLPDSPPENRLTEANLQAMADERPTRASIKPLPPPWI